MLLNSNSNPKDICSRACCTIITTPVNLVSLVASEQGLPNQPAFDFVDELVSARVKQFVLSKNSIPTWGPSIDADVRTYVRGLEDCIAGILQWCFESERYFGKDASRVAIHRLVDLD